MNKLRRIILFLIIIISTQNVSAATKPLSARTEWVACKTAQDCTAVKLGCYYWQPVNQRFATRMVQEYSIDCRSYRSPGKMPELICEENTCTAKRNQTGFPSLKIPLGVDWFDMNTPTKVSFILKSQEYRKASTHFSI